MGQVTKDAGTSAGDRRHGDRSLKPPSPSGVMKEQSLAQLSSRELV